VQARAEDAAAQEAAQQEMAADVEDAEDARLVRERAWEEEQAAREAERLSRQQQAKSRAQNWSQRTSKTEDEAEAYYRQALQSERQAAAAEVQVQKDEMTSQNDRWRAEAEGRAAQARRESSTLDNGIRRVSSKDVQDAYAGREPEHRQERAAVLEEIEALKRANNALQSMRSEVGRNRGLEAMLDLDMQVAASQEQGQELVLSSEDRDIPQGVQETSYDIQNGLVIQRTVRIGDVVERYRKVVTKTGTYYFRGDKSITKDLWEMNTNLSYD
jgi:chemotaxis protein histidine kinase CheA